MPHEEMQRIIEYDCNWTSEWIECGGFFFNDRLTLKKCRQSASLTMESSGG